MHKCAWVMAVSLNYCTPLHLSIKCCNGFNRQKQENDKIKFWKSVPSYVLLRQYRWRKKIIFPSNKWENLKKFLFYRQPIAYSTVCIHTSLLHPHVLENGIFFLFFFSCVWMMMNFGILQLLFGLRKMFLESAHVLLCQKLQHKCLIFILLSESNFFLEEIWTAPHILPLVKSTSNYKYNLYWKILILWGIDESGIKNHYKSLKEPADCFPFLDSHGPRTSGSPLTALRSKRFSVKKKKKKKLNVECFSVY